MTTTMTIRKTLAHNFINIGGFLAIDILPKLLICVGIILIILATALFYKNRISTGWIATTGMVTTASMESYTVQPKTSLEPETTYYYSKVNYEYKVSQTTYQGSMTIGDVSANTPSPVEAILSNYPEGQIVNVYYDPETPSTSTILTYTNTFPWVKVSLGFLIMIIGFIPASVYRALVDHLFQSKQTIEEEKVCRTLKNKQTRTTLIEPAPKKEPVPEIIGKWKLDYQIPTMGEIVAYSITASGNSMFDLNSLMMTGNDKTTVSITGQEITFNYHETSKDGACRIISNYTLNGDKLVLDHKEMDFMMTEIEDFPPQHYTYALKGKGLTLTTNEIKGLGNKKIVYQLSRN